MKTVLEYLMYCLPLALIALSRMYMLRYRRLLGSGKVPDIVKAKSCQSFYFAMSILTALALFFI